MPTREQRDAFYYVRDVARKALVDFPHPVSIELRDRRGSFHRRQNGVHQLVFGTGSIQRCLDSGWSEYDTVAAKLGLRNGFVGQEALHRLALHEAAHAFQVAEGQRYRGSVHNRHFIEHLRRLCEKVPYNGDKMYSRNPQAPRRSQAWCRDRYKTGQVVSFEYEATTYHATVIRFNSKTMTLEQTDTKAKWRMPYSVHDVYNVRPFESGVDLDGLFD